MSLPLYERFAQVMEHLCSHDGGGGHGYTQAARWGDGTYETVTLSDGSSVQVANGDRDCSSGIISALQAVGVDTHGASYTGDMRECLTASGAFDWVPISEKPYARRGDIYLNEKRHTAMCTSDDPDMLCQFSISENGTIYGSQGDQTGRESNFRAYYNYPWDGRLVWKDRDATEAGAAPEPTQEEAPQEGASSGAGLEVDGLWGPATTRALQEALGTPADGVVSDQHAAYESRNPGLLSSSWEWTSSPSQGSMMVKALQGVVGAGVDGIAGDETFSKLQSYLGTPADGRIDRPSMCVEALQRRLNGGEL